MFFKKYIFIMLHYIIFFHLKGINYFGPQPFQFYSIRPLLKMCLTPLPWGTSGRPNSKSDWLKQQLDQHLFFAQSLQR